MASKKRLGLPLWAWIFLLVLLLIAPIVGIAYWVAETGSRSHARPEANDALSGHLAVLTSFQQERYRQLEMISRIFVTDPVMPTYIAEAIRDLSTGRRGAGGNLLELVEQYQDILGFDLAVVLDHNRRVLLSTDNPQARGTEVGEERLVERALEEEDRAAFGVWSYEDRLYDALAMPLVRDYDLIGYVIVGFTIDNALALQAKRSDRAETVYLADRPSGPEPVSSTLGSGELAGLMDALEPHNDSLVKVLASGETVDGLELELAGRNWLALLAPLRGAGGEPVGIVAALTSVSERLAFLDTLRLVLFGLGGLGILLALPIAILLSRRTLGPVRHLNTAVRAAAGGELEAPLPVGSGEVGRLSSSLDRLFSTLRERHAVEGYTRQVSRHLPEPAREDGVVRPRSLATVLAAFEMRRYADPKLGYDAEEGVARLGRDLRRISAAVVARRGRPESVYGHRVLASFQGDGAAYQALAAATEVLLALSQRENAFDEPQPPVAALAAGTAVTGTVTWGDRRAGAVIGLPVQQLESLLREGTPGSLLISPPVHEELAPALQQAGVQVPVQRGLLSSQPLYVLPTELAQRATGVEIQQTSDSLVGDRHTLSDLSPGLLLGGRFELLAQLGIGPRGVVYKVRDREAHDFLSLKLLRPEALADALQLERMKSQILQARSIRHPNVVPLYDFAEVASLPFVAMQYVRGMSLRYLLDQSRRVPVLASLALARQVAAGLAAVHGERVLHLGLKPENILVEPTGDARIMDFGLTVASRDPLQASPYYQAPEQLSAGTVDGCTDVYAFGVVLYEMLTGELPFSGGTPDEIRRQHLEVAPPSVSASCPECPAALEALIQRCLAKQPEQRFAELQQLLAALEEIRA